MLDIVFLLSAATAVLGESLPAGSLAVPIHRGSQYAAYFTKLKVGTPPQEEELLIDTGSGTFSFEDPNNNVCSLQSRPCAEYGTFVNTSSTTCEWVNNDFSDTLFDSGYGSTLQDVIEVGGVNVGKLQFGYITDYIYGPTQVAVPTKTILGLALTCFTGLNSGCYETGYFLVPQLYDQGTITRRSISIYLGPEASNVTNSELILGGAYDKAKQASKPFAVPMVYSNSETNSVNVSAVSATIDGNVTRLDLNPLNTTLIDTGNPILTIPDPLYGQIMEKFGNPNETLLHGPVVDCKCRALPTSEKLSFEFGSAHERIDVPLAQLVIDFGNGTCGADISSGGDISNGLGPLADPFIRQAYITLDYDEFTVTLSQARFTLESDIVAFGK